MEDPKSNVGSGGATVNALLTITEYISAQQGHSVSQFNLCIYPNNYIDTLQTILNEICNQWKKKLAIGLQRNFVIERTQHIDKSYQIHLRK